MSKALGLYPDEKGPPRIDKKFLLAHCKKHKLYQTPHLNDVLYLHYQGFHDIEGLEEYVGLKCLWLECNAISEIKGLNAQQNLKCLYLQHNLIKKIKNLECCPELDSLNLSHNHIMSIDNCGIEILPALSTLNLAHNYLRHYENLVNLEHCENLSVLDLSHNRIEDILVVKIFAKMPSLRVLVLEGNPVVSNIPQYRKTMILECKILTYLDSRPVFPKDRACAEAWKRGGYEEERRELQRWNKRDRKKMRDSVNATLRLRLRHKGQGDADITLLPTSSDESDTESKRYPGAENINQNDLIASKRILGEDDVPPTLTLEIPKNEERICIVCHRQGCNLEHSKRKPRKLLSEFHIKPEDYMEEITMFNINNTTVSIKNSYSNEKIGEHEDMGNILSTVETIDVALTSTVEQLEPHIERKPTQLTLDFADEVKDENGYENMKKEVMDLPRSSNNLKLGTISVEKGPNTTEPIKNSYSNEKIVEHEDMGNIPTTVETIDVALTSIEGQLEPYIERKLTQLTLEVADEVKDGNVNKNLKKVVKDLPRSCNNLKLGTISLEKGIKIEDQACIEDKIIDKVPSTRDVKTNIYAEAQISREEMLEPIKNLKMVQLTLDIADIFEDAVDEYKNDDLMIPGKDSFSDAIENDLHTENSILGEEPPEFFISTSSFDQKNEIYNNSEKGQFLEVVDKLKDDAEDDSKNDGLETAGADSLADDIENNLHKENSILTEKPPEALTSTSSFDHDTDILCNNSKTDRFLEVADELKDNAEDESKNDGLETPGANSLADDMENNLHTENSILKGEPQDPITSNSSFDQNTDILYHNSKAGQFLEAVDKLNDNAEVEAEYKDLKIIAKNLSTSGNRNNPYIETSISRKHQLKSIIETSSSLDHDKEKSLNILEMNQLTLEMTDAGNDGKPIDNDLLASGIENYLHIVTSISIEEQPNPLAVSLKLEMGQTILEGTDKFENHFASEGNNTNLMTVSKKSSTRGIETGRYEETFLSREEQLESKIVTAKFELVTEILSDNFEMDELTLEIDHKLKSHVENEGGNKDLKRPDNEHPTSGMENYLDTGTSMTMMEEQFELSITTSPFDIDINSKLDYLVLKGSDIIEDSAEDQYEYYDVETDEKDISTSGIQNCLHTETSITMGELSEPLIATSLLDFDTEISSRNSKLDQLILTDTGKFEDNANHAEYKDFKAIDKYLSANSKELDLIATSKLIEQKIEPFTEIQSIDCNTDFLPKKLEMNQLILEDEIKDQANPEPEISKKSINDHCKGELELIEEKNCPVNDDELNENISRDSDSVIMEELANEVSDNDSEKERNENQIALDKKEEIFKNKNTCISTQIEIVNDNTTEIVEGSHSSGENSSTTWCSSSDETSNSSKVTDVISKDKSSQESSDESESSGMLDSPKNTIREFLHSYNQFLGTIIEKNKKVLSEPVIAPEIFVAEKPNLTDTCDQSPAQISFTIDNIIDGFVGVEGFVGVDADNGNVEDEGEDEDEDGIDDEGLHDINSCGDYKTEGDSGIKKVFDYQIVDNKSISEHSNVGDTDLVDVVCVICEDMDVVGFKNGSDILKTGGFDDDINNDNNVDINNVVESKNFRERDIEKVLDYQSITEDVNPGVAGDLGTTEIDSSKNIVDIINVGVIDDSTEPGDINNGLEFKDHCERQIGKVFNHQTETVVVAEDVDGSKDVEDLITVRFEKDGDIKNVSDLVNASVIGDNTDSVDVIAVLNVNYDRPYIVDDSQNVGVGKDVGIDSADGDQSVESLKCVFDFQNVVNVGNIDYTADISNTYLGYVKTIGNDVVYADDAAVNDEKNDDVVNFRDNCNIEDISDFVDIILENNFEMFSGVEKKVVDYENYGIKSTDSTLLMKVKVIENETNHEAIAEKVIDNIIESIITNKDETEPFTYEVQAILPDVINEKQPSKSDLIRSLLASPFTKEMSQTSYVELNETIEKIRNDCFENVSSMVHRVYEKKDRYDDDLAIVDNKLVVIEREKSISEICNNDSLNESERCSLEDITANPKVLNAFTKIPSLTIVEIEIGQEDFIDKPDDSESITETFDRVTDNIMEFVDSNNYSKISVPIIQKSRQEDTIESIESQVAFAQTSKENKIGITSKFEAMFSSKVEATVVEALQGSMQSYKAKDDTRTKLYNESSDSENNLEVKIISASNEGFSSDEDVVSFLSTEQLTDVFCRNSLLEVEEHKEEEEDDEVFYDSKDYNSPFSDDELEVEYYESDTNITAIHSDIIITKSDNSLSNPSNHQTLMTSDNCEASLEMFYSIDPNLERVHQEIDEKFGNELSEAFDNFSKDKDLANTDIETVRPPSPSTCPQLQALRKYIIHDRDEAEIKEEKKSVLLKLVNKNLDFLLNHERSEARQLTKKILKDNELDINHHYPEDCDNKSTDSKTSTLE